MRFVVRRVVVLGIARGWLNIRFGHCTSCLFDNSSVKLCKHDTPFHSCRKARIMSRVWGWTAFAQRSAAMKAPVGLLSGSAVCDSRWRGVALTSAAPTRSLRKCRRIEEVKSRMDRIFSRIENLWPRDGSCPLPLRSKSFPGNCFRIVKTQKISKRSLLMYGSHRLLRTKFLPLFVQRRCLARPRKV